MRRQRPRHDELQAPLNYTRRDDGRLEYTPERPPVTDDDRTLAGEVQRLACALVDPMQHARDGMHPKAREALSAAYEALMGRPRLS